jgi:cytochrome P450
MTKSPPGSLGLPFVGEAMKFLEDPFAFTLSRTRKHGNVWKTRILGDTVVFFAGANAFSAFMDPDNFTRDNGSPRFLQEILHPDAVPFIDGDRHAVRKQLLLSAFTPAAIDSYLPAMFRVFERFATKWSAAGDRAIAADLSQLGFDLANTLFAAADPAISNEAVCADFTTCNRGTFSPPINLPFTSYGKAIRARDRLRAYIKQAVAASDGAGTALGMLKTARGPAGQALSTDEIEIELLHFFFAAHGAITAALAWLLVVLGQHPDLAARLRSEADPVLAAAGVPSLAQTEQLAAARAVSREVLRAYPIVPTTFIGVAKRDLEVDGYAIKAGWKGAGAIWATLQDGTQFTDPTTFNSDRLADPTMKALPAHAWVPMGAGGHRCAGYALVNAVLPAFLGWFVKHYDLALPAQDVSPGRGALGPLPADGLWVSITERTT